MNLPLFKVLVGSQAHGLATPESDNDYRGVFVVPTEEILKTFAKPQSNSWIEGKEDDTSYEIGHFLELAQKCNPSIIEMFFAPVVETTPLGDALLKIFPYVWNTNDLVNAAIGYSHNQRKKMLDDHMNRKWKYATAYVRTLMQTWDILTKGKIEYPYSEERLKILRKIRNGEMTVGEVTDLAEHWTDHVQDAAADHKDKETDKETIDKFLIMVRRRFLGPTIQEGTDE